MNKNPQYAVLIDKNIISNFDMFKSLLTSNNNSSISNNGSIIYSNANSIKINLMIKRLDKGTLGYIFAFVPCSSVLIKSKT